MDDTIMVRIKIFLICLGSFLSFSAGNLHTFEDSFAFGASENITCKQLLEQFANTSSNFVYCAVKNARPIRICQACVTELEDVRASHEAILHVEDGEGNVKCKEKLLNLDRLEVIEKGFTYITDMWDGANCQYCFDSVNGSLVLANHTTQFFELLNSTQVCFLNHSTGDDTYNKTACVDCEKMYGDMNSFYDGLKNSKLNECMDIKDAMNVTRMLWNDKLQCKQKIQPTDVIYFGCSGAIAALPILFYLGAKLSSSVLRTRLQIQKRLAEVIRPSSSGDT
ncbi:osteopetrosis-associated transmembrane protein 1 [Thrips palmi]|uniref:Osteopetrosis-associated transmembrane protein 1 n=1 Tax=Thrips palmi TaxID=161013 RepID=A0A6P8YNA1_THRPL|nr:osteopetrosis-associated transmembrane protein 1 [Thrips palmi]